MRIIGITGGVGAGKSQILAYLEQKYGACVIQADHVGHLVMEPDGQAYKPVVDLFGSNIVNDNGTIDREKLGAQVFANREKLESLNAIVHPAVKSWICQEIKRQEKAGCKLLIIEAALLIEDHYEKLCDEFWYIYTAEAVRRERLKVSRGYSDEKIDAILKNQLSEAEFRAACQEVIDNSGSWESTSQQIDLIFS